VTYETLLVDVREGVASVTLNRPDVRNALSATLAGFSPTALGLAKEAAATSTGIEYDAALRYLRELLTLVALSDDAREGIKAFFEKRAPNWTGR
jgi:enoyl-CoA hydratase/carnithine racemase